MLAHSPVLTGPNGAAFNESTLAYESGLVATTAAYRLFDEVKSAEQFDIWGRIISGSSDGASPMA